MSPCPYCTIIILFSSERIVDSAVVGLNGSRVVGINTSLDQCLSVVPCNSRADRLYKRITWENCDRKEFFIDSRNWLHSLFKPARFQNFSEEMFAFENFEEYYRYCVNFKWNLLILSLFTCQLEIVSIKTLPTARYASSFSVRGGGCWETDLHVQKIFCYW